MSRKRLKAFKMCFRQLVRINWVDRIASMEVLDEVRKNASSNERCTKVKGYTNWVYSALQTGIALQCAQEQYTFLIIVEVQPFQYLYQVEKVGHGQGQMESYSAKSNQSID